SIMSVVDYVDKILIWDTGSTDKTVEIIKEIIKIKGNKIDFEEVGEVDKNKFSKMRQKMLEESYCDWTLVLDGDEIWWEDSIKKLISKIKTDGNNIEGVVVPMKVPAGDIYHFQEESAGQYRLMGRKGHLSLRAINKKISGLHVAWPYGKESYLDGDSRPIQQRTEIIFLDAPYLHVTHLKRSSLKRSPNKFKFELGSNKKDFKYPEVFYKAYPSIIQSPWVKISGIDLVAAKLMTPLRKIKRRLL
ncbi:MAG: glycosyltransferase, partial [Patescibacteria group bacterium]